MCFISKLIIKKKKEKPLRYCYSYFIDEIERAEKFKTSTKPHIKKQPPDLNPKFDSRVHVLNHLSQLRYNMSIKCGEWSRTQKLHWLDLCLQRDRIEQLTLQAFDENDAVYEI